MFRRKKHSDNESKGIKEYMNKPIDKDILEGVTGGFGEYINEIFENAQTPGEQLRDVATLPDAKKEKGSYKKTR